MRREMGLDAHLVDELTTIASKAAAAVLSIPRTALAVENKADYSPVTAADKASDAVISEGLRLLLPGVLVVSEESTKRPISIAGDATFILVDPLDGTKEFLANRDDFTVNIALIVEGRPVAGVLAVPALGLIFRGIVGGGGERLRLAVGASSEQATETIPLTPRWSPSDGLVAMVSRSHLEPATEAFLGRLAVVKKIPCGSALKFCRIAEGQADVYPRLSPTCEWDIAAGHALLAAIGGDVTTPEGGAISYGGTAADFRIPAFVAWGRPAVGMIPQRL
jgi:3'(2'), 5'-bisphosphate nucleotidase